VKATESRDHRNHRTARRVVNGLEWCLLVALLIAVAYVFFRRNGFINPSDIQPYPY